MVLKDMHIHKTYVTTVMMSSSESVQVNLQTKQKKTDSKYSLLLKQQNKLT